MRDKHIYSQAMSTMTEELVIAKMAFQLQTCDAPVSDDNNAAVSVNDGKKIRSTY